MKYLLPFLSLLLLGSCKKECQILYVGLEVEAKNNLSQKYIRSQDTLELSISFPKQLLNSYTSELYDISPVDPRFSLNIRKYDFDTQQKLHLDQHPGARDDFDLSIELGESFEEAFLSLSPFPNQIDLRPQLEQGQYTLQIKLNRQSSGELYFIYWNIYNQDDRFYSSKEHKKADPCRDFIKVNINNKGRSNGDIIQQENTLTEIEEWVSKHGLLFFFS